MDKIALMNMLVKNAQEYNKNSLESIKINRHMNDISENEKLEKQHIEATLVDFINFIGIKQGLDYGLYTSDLKQ